MLFVPAQRKLNTFFATAEGERSERPIEKQIYLMRGKKNRQMWKEWESRDVRWRERGGQVQEKVGGEYIELVEKWENGQKGVWAESNLKENCSDGWKCMQREEAGQGDRMMSWAEQLLDCRCFLSGLFFMQPFKMWIKKGGRKDTHWCLKRQTHPFHLYLFTVRPFKLQNIYRKCSHFVAPEPTSPLSLYTSLLSALTGGSVYLL